MLRYSRYPLPAEIYDMIYSHLSLNHLAAIQKTCRLLFRVTCPYVWRSVDIESLLQLLPGCVKETGKVSTLEITTPSPIPPDYFIRFFHYARFVKCIKITPQFMISGSFEEELSELAILTSTTDHLILPHLHTAQLAMLESPGRYDDDYDDYAFWIGALIPSTIRHISFQAAWNDNESLLQALLSKAPELTSLEFAPEERSPRFFKQILGPDKMRNVQHLRYTGSIMLPEVLLWLAEMPLLSSLELFIDPGDTEEPFSFPEMTFPDDSFRSLTTLKAFTSDHGDIIEECNLLKQVWKTPLVRHLTSVEIKLSSPIYPDMKEFDQLMSSLSAHSLGVSSFRLEASGQPEHFPEITVEVLSGVKRLPLQSLSLQSPLRVGGDQSLFKSLGSTFAKLEDLDLSTTVVEISDVINAHGYLPGLRYLNIAVWQTKTNKKKLQSTLFTRNMPTFTIPAQPPGSSCLSIRFCERQKVPHICAYNLDFSDVDLIAILLAARWTSIQIQGNLPQDRQEFLKTRADYWRYKADRRWEKIAEKVLLLSNRNRRR